MDWEMAPPVERNPADKHRRAAALRSLPPFQLSVPDLTPSRKPRPAVSAPASPQSASAGGPTENDPVAAARARVSQRRYDDGHQHVTSLIGRMRDRRRQLFGRLWIASVILTALSIIALVVEVIQNLNAPQATAEAELATVDAKAVRPSTGRLASRSTRNVVPAEAQTLATDLPESVDGEQPVQPAHYTTDRPGKPQGVWLDGTIDDKDSENANR
jgi:hypothetical protein